MWTIKEHPLHKLTVLKVVNFFLFEPGEFCDKDDDAGGTQRCGAVGEEDRR
jgi:hypothetical protein